MPPAPPPSARRPPIIARAMRATMSPYSIAVAPFWFASIRRIVFRIAITPPSSGPRPRGRNSRYGLTTPAVQRLTALHPFAGSEGVQAAKWSSSNVSVERPSRAADAKCRSAAAIAARDSGRRERAERMLVAPIARRSRTRSRKPA